ncbi:hypothetical protein PAXINDRAFT_86139, partial [Paxillus involutus ATCC 200175]
SILATCALTMLVCVWNATYPNIMPAKRWYTVALYRGVLGIMALLAPELTTVRAFLHPDEMRNASDEQWTRTHGFFALMGGFVIQDGPQQKTLRPCNDLQYLRDEIVVNPEIMKEEMSNKSKCDGLGNALLVVQLLWFILQVVARASNHLAITLLEINTLALAALSPPLFFFWWSKPMAAACPHIFYLKDVPETSSTEILPHHQENAITVSPKRGWWDETIGGALDDDVDKDGLYSFGAFFIVWVIFGGLHLIAWNFQFPTQAERIIWRVASLTLVTAPCIVFLGLVLGKTVARDDDVPGVITTIMFIIGVVARFVLLVLMLASLRDLPSSTYQTVSWTSYVPHL